MVVPTTVWEAMGMTRLDDGEHDILRKFAAKHGVTQTQLLGALVRRLHLSKITVAEAVEDARERDVEGRTR